MNSLIEVLGIGVGLRSTHFNQILKEKPENIQWLEVISENYMPWLGNDFSKSMDSLVKIREFYPIAMHGVSMNLGSCDELDLDYMRGLKRTIEKINPFIVSDHLSWTGVNGQNLHDLIPVPYTEEALKLIVNKINQVQDFLGRRILVENPSTYLEFSISEMPEPLFVKEVLKQTDCGLLLDINNVYVSSVNHGFNPIGYLEQIPKDRVGQIHLAGHRKVKNYLIDTHDEPICEEVWNLYRWSVSFFGPRNVMIERDDNIPEWGEFQLEISKLKEIYEKATKSL